MQQEWLEDGRTLFILCEEGDFELSDEYCRIRKIDRLSVDSPDVFTKEYCEELVRKYSPAQIAIEFNGMWDLQEFLKKDTTVSQKILDKWEDKLLSCGAVHESETLYGVVYRVCPHYQVTYLKCSDGKTYKPYADEDGIAYITKEEYYETHSSSSVAESSSSSVPEDLVTNCPQDSFALFVDILADVQKEVYGKIVKLLDENDTLPEAKRAFLDSIINREEKTLRGNLYPYQRGQFYDLKYISLKRTSDYWFDGYVAKTRTCTEGTPETTALYREKYDGILQECLDLINKELEKLDAE
jgi:hypothetical protein